ncbi:cache domain-containing sensor histidine kinase [Alteribacillus bidgolensis]|uniref:histidine kinase n=1 Tax=Alteribacillus bidgolensis TaxID=930129 RepID=A0A1G8GXC5_9BACI|nr:sensor histidine kinase [Alteribacillus bidgolensis]SDH98880.1 two-component system, sensor histidine kinase YesM [Alteribacillus bidgolensis]
MSIKKKFYTLVVFMVIIPLTIIGLILYEFTSTLYRDQINDHMQDTLEAIDLNINTVLSEIELFTEHVVTSESLQSHFTNEWASSSEEIINENTISRMSFTNPLTYDYQVVGENQKNLYYLNPVEEYFHDFAGSSFLENVNQQQGGTYWVGPENVELKRQPVNILTVGRSVIDPQTLEHLGYYILFVEPELLQSVDNLGQNSDSDWVILDQEGTIVYNTSPGELGEDVVHAEDNTYTNEEGKEFFFTSKSTFQGWKLVSFQSMETMNSVLTPVLLFTIGIIASLFFILFLFHKLFSKRLMSFIQYFKYGMGRASMGNLNVQLTPYKEQEFTMLTNSFNDMVAQLRTTIEQVEKEQKERNQAEFKVLQHQINPHFLYNTLESVNALASLNKTAEVQHLVTNLGKLLRISLKGPYEIPVKEELKHVTSYLEIQKIRHNDRFTYEVDLEETVNDQYILKLVLQPLVENAIEHGLKGKSFDHIAIDGVKNESAIILKITDNGPGFSEEALELLNMRTIESTQSGHGLLNVHDRIQMYYKENSGLLICSEPGNTTIQMTIPVQKGGRDYVQGSVN